MPRDAGLTFDITGKPIVQGRGSVSGVTIILKDNDMVKATQNGVYTLNGGRFRIRAGDVLPEGAVLDSEASEPEPEESHETQKKGPAPENKAKPTAPQNRAS